MADNKTEENELDYQCNIGNINNGSVPEIFAKLHQQVMDNIRDVNTSEKAKRSITLKITYAPTPDRKAALTMVDTTTKLAPHRIEPSMVHIAKIKGRVIGFIHDPSQDELRFGEQTGVKQ